MIIGIVAISENYAIGRGGKLPWHYSADLKHFKETTMGGTIVMC
jgi:dihydrofolate reductase